MERLLSLDFVRQGQNLFITGSSGTGKSFLVTAIGYQAYKSGIRTLYSNTSRLLCSLKVVKAKGTIGDPTVADAVLDRIVHSAHQIELTGESVRKMKARK